MTNKQERIIVETLAWISVIVIISTLLFILINQL